MYNENINLVMTTEDELIGIIDTELKTYILSEDISCFETCYRKACSYGLNISGSFIVEMERETAYVLNTHEGLGKDDIEKIYVDSDDFFDNLNSLKEAFNIYSIDEDLSNRFVNSVRKKMNIWKENKKPEFMLNGIPNGSMKMHCEVEELFGDNLKYLRTSDIENRKINNPNERIFMNFPKVSDIMRAYDVNISDDSYMVAHLISSRTTNEFDQDDEQDADDVLCKLDKSSVLPKLDTKFNFKYFLDEIVTDFENKDMLYEAVDSIYYKKNITTLKIDMGENNKLLYLISGDETKIEETVKPNEELLYKYLEQLMLDCIMYEYSNYIPETIKDNKLLKSRIFESYIYDCIKIITYNNYAYTGKAYLDLELKSNSQDIDELDFALGIVGYNRITEENGSYVCEMKEIDRERLKDNLDLNSNIDKYLRNMPYNNSSILFFIQYLRFGETKNRYIKVCDDESIVRKYYDTLECKSLTEPKIKQKYLPMKTKNGNDYEIYGQIWINSVISQIDSKLNVPIGIVIRQRYNNGQTDRYKYTAIDAMSFYIILQKQSINNVIVDIDGIMVTSNGYKISDELKEKELVDYTSTDVAEMLSRDIYELDEGDIYNTLHIRSVTKTVNDICRDADIPKDKMNIFEAYSYLETKGFIYSSDYSNVRLDTETPEEYTVKKIIAIQMDSLISQSLATPKKKNIIEIVDMSNTKSENDFDSTEFNKYMSKASLFCKIKTMTDKEVGYLFICKTKEGKTLNLIISKEELGFNVPNTNEWKVIRDNKIPKPVFLMWDKLNNPEEYLKVMREHNYIIFSKDTVNLIRSAING